MNAVEAVEDLIMVMIARRGTSIRYDDSIKAIRVPGKNVDIAVKDGEIRVYWAGYLNHGFSVPLADPDAISKLIDCLFWTAKL